MKTQPISQLAFLTIFTLLPALGNGSTNHWYDGMWRTAGLPHFETRSVFVEKDAHGRIVMELRNFDCESSVLQPIRSPAHVVTVKGTEQLYATNFPGQNISVRLKLKDQDGQPSLGVRFFDGCANCELPPGIEASSGLQHLSGNVTPLNISVTDRHLENFQELHERWSRTSRERLLKLANEGDWRAQFYIGAAALGRNRPDFNREDAYRWSWAAATNGVVNAMANLAYAFARGFGADPNTDQAFAWLYEAAKADATFPNRILGNFHSQGWGVPINQTKAIAYWKKANAAGDAESLRTLLHHYLVGTTNDVADDLLPVLKDGIHHNLEIANTSLTKLIDSGYGRYRRTVGARKWLKVAAAMGIGSAQCQLGRLLASGTDGEIDLEKAISWQQIALNNGFSEAAAELGALLEFRSAVPDFTKAAAAYRQGAMLGDNESRCRLAILHLNGKHGKRSDALPLLKLAAQNGFGWAESLLEDNFPSEAARIVAEAKRNLPTPQALRSELRRIAGLQMRHETQPQIPGSMQKLAPHFPLIEHHQETSFEWQKITLNQSRTGVDAIRVRSPKQPGRYNITLGLAHPKIMFYKIGRNIVPRIGSMDDFRTWERITQKSATETKAPWRHQFHGFDAHIQTLKHGQLKPGQDYVIWFVIPKAEPMECHISVSITPAE